jgi:hypothetical protein
MAAKRERAERNDEQATALDREPERDPVLARLDALRAENVRLGIDSRDSVEILRDLRERYAR